MEIIASSTHKFPDVLFSSPFVHDKRPLAHGAAASFVRCFRHLHRIGYVCVTSNVVWCDVIWQRLWRELLRHQCMLTQNRRLGALDVVILIVELNFIIHEIIKLYCLPVKYICIHSYV